MNKIILVFFLAVLSFKSLGQKRKVEKTSTFAKGAIVTNIGIGYFSPYINSGSSLTIPPIHLSAEYGLSNRIGLGFLMGYARSVRRDVYEYNYTYIVPQVRINFHLVNLKRINFYVGIGGGYNIASCVVNSSSLTSVIPDQGSFGGLALSVYGGGRYYFTENIGVFAEGGYSMAYISGGLVFRIR